MQRLQHINSREKDANSIPEEKIVLGAQNIQGKTMRMSLFIEIIQETVKCQQIKAKYLQKISKIKNL